MEDRHARSAARPASHSYFSQRLRLHYVDWGNPDAPPLLLVHGGRDHCRNWDWVAEALREDYHIIAPDLRGHGDSQWMIGGSYAISEYVYDIAQLLHQAGDLFGGHGVSCLWLISMRLPSGSRI